MSVEEADLLVENGLGSRPSPLPTGNLFYTAGPVYDPLAAAQAESAYNQRVNEARYYGEIQQRDERNSYGRYYPVYRRYPGCYGYCRNSIGYRRMPHR